MPRNERSLAFHDAMGFADVGEQSDEGTGKTVRMYAREL
jgi:predicted GNAT superfamily acetyltransferase